MEVVSSRTWSHRGLRMKAWRRTIHGGCDAASAPGIWGQGGQTQQRYETSDAGVSGSSKLMLERSRGKRWLPQDETALVRKIPRNTRQTCLNGSVSHLQEFVEQKGDHAMATQGDEQRVVLWKDQGGPENTEPAESLPPWWFLTHIHRSRSPFLLLLLLWGTGIVQFFLVDREVLGMRGA